MVVHAIATQETRLAGKQVLKKTAKKAAVTKERTTIQSTGRSHANPTAAYTYQPSPITTAYHQTTAPAGSYRRRVNTTNVVRGTGRYRKAVAHSKNPPRSKINWKRLRLKSKMRFLIPYLMAHSAINFFLLVVIGLAFGAEKIPFGLGDAEAEMALAGMYAVSIFMTLGIMLVTVLLASASRVNPLLHKNNLLLVLVFALYMMPGVNLAPWIQWWARKITVPE